MLVGSGRAVRVGVRLGVYDGHNSVGVAVGVAVTAGGDTRCASA